MKQRIRDLLYITSTSSGTMAATVSGDYYYSDIQPAAFVDLLCLKEGSSLRGAAASSHFYFGNHYKAPVWIPGNPGTMLIPTRSYDEPDCTWLSYLNIQEVKPFGDNQTLIVFYGDRTLVVPIGIRSIRRQMKRCSEHLRIIRDADWFDDQGLPEDDDGYDDSIQETDKT